MITGTNHIPGLSALAAVLIAAFLIERTVAGILFGLAFSQAWITRFPDPARVADPATSAKADRDRKPAWFLIAALVAAIFTLWRTCAFSAPIGLTEILKPGAGKPADEAKQAIEVKGSLIVQEAVHAAHKDSESAAAHV